MPFTPDELETLEHATLEEIERRIDLAEWEKIEDAESHASAKQLAFQRAFFNRADDTGRKCSKFIAIGGNRSGKTISTSKLCFSKFMLDHARTGDLFWAGSQNLDRSIGGLQKEIWESLPAGLFRGRIWDSKLGFGGNRTVQVSTRDGGYCTVEFRSADQDLNTFETAKLRGLIWDENLPEQLYNRLLPRLIDLDGFFLYSDINNQAWPIERLEEALPEAGVYYQNFSMYDNEANLPPNAIAEFAAGLTAEEIALRVDGKPGAMEGVVFKVFRNVVTEYRGPGKPSHVVEYFPIPANWPRWRLIDFGETAPIACSWAAISPNEEIFVYREHYVKGKSIFANAKLIHEASGATWRELARGSDELHEKPWIQLLPEGGEAYVQNFMDPACFGTDKRSRVTVAREFQDCGIHCRPWPRANLMGEHAQVARFKRRLELFTWYVFESCTQFRREMRVWKHKLDANGMPVAADAYENANNHLIDGQKGFIATSPTFVIVKSISDQ